MVWFGRDPKDHLVPPNCHKKKNFPLSNPELESLQSLRVLTTFHK